MFTNQELIETIINDLNAILRLLFAGNPLQACVLLTGTTQKLTNLRASIDNDIKNRDEIIEKLKKELCRRGDEVAEIGGVNE